VPGTILKENIMAKKKVPITRARASSSGGQSAVISTVDWLKYLIIAAIPILGLVMCFVWAFGRGNLNRRNLFRAVLILMAIGIVLGIIFGSVTQGIFGSLFDVFRGI
jgi:hypothetical protein